MSDQLHKISDLQLSLLKVLWQRGRLSVSQVQSQLKPENDLALTTVGTMLKRMQEKGLVDYEKQGRQFVYFAKITEAEVKNSMLDRIVSELFGGKPEALVHHLVADDEVNQKDLEKIRQLLAKDDQKND